MKRICALLLLCSFVLFSSCTKNDNQAIESFQTEPINMSAVFSDLNGELKPLDGQMMAESRASCTANTSCCVTSSEIHKTNSTNQIAINVWGCISRDLALKKHNAMFLRISVALDHPTNLLGTRIFCVGLQKNNHCVEYNLLNDTGNLYVFDCDLIPNDEKSHRLILESQWIYPNSTFDGCDTFSNSDLSAQSCGENINTINLGAKICK